MKHRNRYLNVRNIRCDPGQPMEGRKEIVRALATPIKARVKVRSSKLGFSSPGKGVSERLGHLRVDMFNDKF